MHLHTNNDVFRELTVTTAFSIFSGLNNYALSLNYNIL